MTEGIHTEWNFPTVQGNGLQKNRYARLKIIVQGWCNMLKGTRIRVTRDCIDKSTGEVWIKRGSTGTLKKIFNNVENFPYEVLLDDGRLINFRRESIAPNKKGRIC